MGIFRACISTYAVYKLYEKMEYVIPSTAEPPKCTLYRDRQKMILLAIFITLFDIAANFAYGCLSPAGRSADNSFTTLYKSIFKSLIVISIADYIVRKYGDQMDLGEWRCKVIPLLPLVILFLVESII